MVVIDRVKEDFYQRICTEVGPPGAGNELGQL